MAVPISNVTRRVVFAPSGTGPYAFTFEILAATDIEVYKGDTLLTLTTDYTVTINANGTGSVTLVLTAGTDNITIVGARAIERLSDFVTGGDFFANTVNSELDSLTIFAQQNAEAVTRSIQAPVTDPTTIDMTLPTKTDRAGKYLSFNTSTGDPEVVNTVVDVTAVAANATNINTVAGISSNVTTVAGVAANVTTVAGVAANVNTVAGVSADVTTVAGISADVTTVAGDSADIATVAGIAADVTSVAGISADVTAVAADATDIGTVATDLAGSNTIGTVAGIAANVSTVAGISADVTTVAADGADIGAVAAIDSDVTTVAGIAANVTTVAGINANIATVAGISADVTTVAGDSADIQLLADNIGTIASKANAGANSDITSLSGLTTPLSVGQGGTGAASLTAENVILGDGTNAVKFVAPGTSGNVLTSNGTTWASTAPAAAAVDKIEEGDSKVEVVDTGTGKIEFVVDNVEVADFTTGEIVFNETGANQDFRVEGDTNANLIVADAGVDKVGIGTNTFNTNGGVLQVSNGISFPATQSACADANTLDDYEEGTWTPSLGGTATYSGTPVGFYVKVGSLVLVRGGLTVATIGTGSTTVISGLPFTTTTENANRVSGSISYYDSLNVNVIALYVYAQPNNTQVSFASSNASGVTFTNDPAAIFKNAANVQFTMTYRAA